ncbi:MAG: hypothetical protein F9K43_07095 [Bauldia sp.]|nr:MAG: hypothetical protein F9K43_07095 [Bauldia sp.]
MNPFSKRAMRRPWQQTQPAASRPAQCRRRTGPAASQAPGIVVLKTQVRCSIHSASRLARPRFQSGITPCSRRICCTEAGMRAGIGAISGRLGAPSAVPVRSRQVSGA